MDVHGLFIHLLLDAQLGFFLVLSFDLKKKAATNISGQNFLWLFILTFLGSIFTF